MPEATPTHPGAQELADFAAGKLARDRTAQLADHFSACAECRQKLDAISPDSFVARLRRSAPRGETVPAIAAPPAVVKALPPAEQPPPELTSSRKYEVLGKLGDGGMGAVWKVRHTFLNRIVAVKVMRPDAMGQEEARDRFLQEMRAVATLQHPRIVRALDAEKAGDLLLLVMECVDGRSLHKLVSQKGPLPVSFACRFAAQAAEGLQHAHEKGMVHRDVKPANLMVTRDTKEVKILDFGLARVPKEQKGTRVETRYQTFMGTPEFVAPEQANDARTADIRADIYSLGCTLYFLLAGRPPFQGDSPYGVVIAHMQERPRPLPEVRPEVSAELWAIVAKMMAKAPRDRYQTPAEVVQALEPIAASARKVEESGEVPVPPQLAAPASTTPLPSPERVLPPPLPTTLPRRAMAARPESGWGGLWRRWKPHSRAIALVAAAQLLVILLTSALTMYMTLPPSDPAEGWAREVTNSIGMKLARIPAGKFTMGSRDEPGRSEDEEPVHEVEITRMFYLGVYEVTQEEYEKVMGKNPSHFASSGAGGDQVLGADTKRFPVESVSWVEAQRFCNELSDRPQEKRAGRKYRLPSEAEWEYACRGGAVASSVFHLGDKLRWPQANFDATQPYGSEEKAEGLKRPAPVGYSAANAFGLHDMHGNVREWCRDWFDPKYYHYSPRKDPEYLRSGERHVVRGGSWQATGAQCRTAYRGYMGQGGPGGPGTPATDKDNTTGFRVVCVPSTRGD